MSDVPLRLPDTIKPFTRDAECPKCTGKDIKSRLHARGVWWCYTMEQEGLQVDWATYENVPQEHLIRTCACGYAWLEWTADRVEPVPPASRFERNTPL